MRILFIHPNYSAGAADIAGNWSPAWVAYIAGYLKSGGYQDYHFIDGLVDKLDDDQMRAAIRASKPDIIATTAMTPMIYAAQRVLQIAKEEHPNAITVLGGIHGTPGTPARSPVVAVLHPGRGVDQHAAVGAAGLQQADAGAGVFGQAGGQRAARRTGAGDDVVEFFNGVHGESFREVCSAGSPAPSHSRSTRRCTALPKGG